MLFVSSVRCFVKVENQFVNLVFTTKHSFSLLRRLNSTYSFSVGLLWGNGIACSLRSPHYVIILWFWLKKYYNWRQIWRRKQLKSNIKICTKIEMISIFLLKFIKCFVFVGNWWNATRKDPLKVSNRDANCGMAAVLRQRSVLI